MLHTRRAAVSDSNNNKHHLFFSNEKYFPPVLDRRNKQLGEKRQWALAKSGQLGECVFMCVCVCVSVYISMCVCACVNLIAQGQFTVPL